jgi:hypothetical protein
MDAFHTVVETGVSIDGKGTEGYMRSKLSACLVGVLLATAVPVVAHHSTAAEYDADKPVTLKGTISRMEWVNPHAWLYVDVKNPDGKVLTWAIELAGPNALIRRGWRRTDLPIGTEVTVKGFLSRVGVFASPTATTRNITLADGKQLFAGTPADGVFGQQK